MTNPEHNPVPLLQAFEAEAIGAHEATPLLYTIIDTETYGYTLRGLNQEQIMEPRAIEIGHGILTAGGYVEQLPRRGRDPHQRPWTATDKLHAAADAYNTMFAEFMSERTRAGVDGEHITQIAVGRMALGYQLYGTSFENVQPILAAADRAGMGHPLSVTHRALVSFALFDRILAPVQRDILEFIRQA